MLRFFFSFLSDPHTPFLYLTDSLCLSYPTCIVCMSTMPISRLCSMALALHLPYAFLTSYMLISCSLHAFLPMLTILVPCYSSMFRHIYSVLFQHVPVLHLLYKLAGRLRDSVPSLYQNPPAFSFDRSQTSQDNTYSHRHSQRLRFLTLDDNF